MFKFRLGVLSALLLLGCLNSKAVPAQAEDDEEIIDLQELLVKVSKSLMNFETELKGTFKGFADSLSTLKNNMAGMKSTVEDIRKSTSESSVSNKDIIIAIEKSTASMDYVEKSVREQLEKSATNMNIVGEDVKEHIKHSANNIGTFGQLMEEQNRKVTTSLNTFENIIRELVKSSNSCSGSSEKFENILSKLQVINKLATTIKSSNQVLKEQIEKTSSSINTVVRDQKEIKETVSTIKEVTKEIHTINSEVQEGSSTCSKSIDAFLKEHQLWKNTLTEKIDKVVEMYGTCDKDGDEDGDKDKDKDKESPMTDCADVYKKFGHRTSGVYNIQPLGYTQSFPAYCDMEDGGGWTVIQKRGGHGSATDYFERTWSEYKYGFGELTKDFWLGNDKIASLTNQLQCQVRIDLWDHGQNHVFARYNDFRVEYESGRYKLRVGGYSGNAGDALKNHNNLMFSTQDKDAAGVQCTGDNRKTGWWYGACSSNLNGLDLGGVNMKYRGQGIIWQPWLGIDYSLAATTIKIRPKNFQSS